MDRRKFLQAISAGAVVTASGLWIPGQKLISIPRPIRFVPITASEVILAQQTLMRNLESHILDAFSYGMAATIPAGTWTVDQAIQLNSNNHISGEMVRLHA